ncbi:putative zinc finger protein [Orchesella cincta]|uniref:Putative zinc finger protein n=1 Tax=Orchesella cincta TaxID=48709 RepID=A0A1D2MVC4_ORCCI|nr:putative zinc finger protein [Orchesella cincta]
MALKGVPHRCLICNSVNSNSLTQHENSEKIAEQLKVIFLLRNVLEVPKENLSTYLMTWGSPQFWIASCSKCNKLIDEARSVYDDMLSSLNRFRVVKQKIVRTIKRSSIDAEPLGYSHGVTKLLITNQTRQFVNIHDYGNFIDPFVTGDRKANQILQNKEWSALTNAVEVKEEVVLDSYVEEDLDDMHNPVERNGNSIMLNDDFIAMNDGLKGESSTLTHESKKTATIVKDSNNEETEDDDDAELFDGHDDDWNPEIESRQNTKNAKNEFQNHVVDQNSIFCPLCKIFKFCIEKREKFCEHLEICKGNSDDNEASQVLNQCCPMCNTYKFSLDGKSDFIDHVMLCKGIVTESSEMTLHDRIFKCSVCPLTKYMRLNTFLQHFLFHKKNIYKCSKCSKRYHWNVGLNYHWRANHKDSTNVPSSERYITDFSVPEVIWWCAVCNQTFPDSETRDVHLQTIHQKEISKTHQCPECSEGFSCNEELKLHQGTLHVSSTSSYTCDICHESFPTATLRRQHKRSKHKDRIGHFVCEICGISCSQQHILNMHMQLHQEVRKFVCECGKSFTSRQYLRNHKFREHVAADEKINPLACKICKRAFHSTTYLQKHIMAVHEKKNRFFCHLCARGFMEQNKLNRHLMMKHGIGDLKKHVCPVEGCNKDFWNSTAFKSHLSRHRNEPRFKCGECGKEFFSSGHFRRHEQIHSGVKPYKCEICFKSFPVRNYLYIHMRSHNKKNQGETVNE